MPVSSAHPVFVVKTQMTDGVCKYYIGPIGDLPLSTATAAAAAHSTARN